MATFPAISEVINLSIRPPWATRQVHRSGSRASRGRSAPRHGLGPARPERRKSPTSWSVAPNCDPAAATSHAPGVMNLHGQAPWTPPRAQHGQSCQASLRRRVGGDGSLPCLGPGCMASEYDPNEGNCPTIRPVVIGSRHGARNGERGSTAAYHQNPNVWIAMVVAIERREEEGKFVRGDSTYGYIGISTNRRRNLLAIFLGKEHPT